MTTGTFPSVFKRALVHPIYKSGDRDSVSNYRPISVLSTLSKIIEKILNNRLLNYLNSNKIIVDNQYGFRQNKKTEDAVLELTSSVAKNINNKLKTIGIFLDLSKAFDTVSIPLLLMKLELIGIRGLPLNIFKSYLTNRTQSVTIGGYTSGLEHLNCGVPQGSVLGPTLFLIYINDLCKLSPSNAKIITYADDTVLLIHGKSWDDARSFAVSALQTIMNWLANNLLTLNLEKTKFITFSPRIASQPPSSFSLSARLCSTTQNCNCIAIKRTDFIKYLGVYVDSMLTWKEQIRSLVPRVRKLIFVFKHLRTAANLQTLKMVYFALAHSMLTYCVTAWGGSVKSLMLPLERSQRAVLKVMTRKPILFPTKELYDLCKLPTVRHSFLLSTILRKHAELPFDAVSIARIRRSDRVCHIEVARFEILKRQYHFISPVLYNRVNRILNVNPVTLRTCKLVTNQWLHTLNYEELELMAKPHNCK
ncbi:unnamed protein product [Arctia plantaginis]|uniref:Reverse transcriptase domain-containing protein n=1 Tax=Arctia plantaginis TaxID=874455 RepID=A0A8S1ANU8_ARCPL|nr:unnamed protein product [Arctia plantaginis]